MRNFFSLGLIAVLFQIGCEDSKKDTTSSSGARSFVSAAVQTWDDISDLSSQTTRIRTELAEQHCVDVYKLPLKANFDTELGVLCKDNKPTTDFLRLDQYAELSGDKPRSVELALKHEADGFTEGLFATVYRVPIDPKWVRSAAIPSYMVAASAYDYVTLEGLISSDLNSELGGDLQFGKWQLKYHTDVKTPDNTSFSNDRTTELNSFQVQGGNPDIGIGTEALIDATNPDYKVYNTTTLTIGNNGGGSTLITIIRVSVKNNGYQDLAEKVISDIASAQATHVHDGLMEELAAGKFP